MKADVKSRYFLFALLAVGAFFVHLLVLQMHVKNVLTQASPSADSFPSIIFYAPYIWISLAGWLYFKATKRKQTAQNQLLAAVLTPIILAPVLGIIHVMMVLLPIYSLAGQSIAQ